MDKGKDIGEAQDVGDQQDHKNKYCSSHNSSDRSFTSRKSIQSSLDLFQLGIRKGHDPGPCFLNVDSVLLQALLDIMTLQKILELTAGGVGL